MEHSTVQDSRAQKATAFHPFGSLRMPLSCLLRAHGAPCRWWESTITYVDGDKLTVRFNRKLPYRTVQCSTLQYGTVQ